MTSSYLLFPLIFLLQTLFGLYTAVVAIRFLLQWTRADFYNPISQFVVRVTTPALRPLRQFIPGYGGLDLASLVLIWLLTTVELALLALLIGSPHSILGAIGWAIPSMVELFINLMLFAVLARALLSWVNSDPRNPMIGLLTRLTDSVMLPIQQRIQPIGGVDLSPLFVIIGLTLLNMLLIPPLKWLVDSPF
ncbi:hypothetical protein CKO09_06750 [Chromatium weissei]|nr:hypothetical protein [Chromatium weissei]